MCVVAGVWIILSHKLVCQQRGLTWDTLHTQGRELAAIIGTTSEKPFTSIIPSQPIILTISQKNLPSVSLKHLVPLRLGGCKQSHVARRTYTGGLDNLLQRSPWAETLLSCPGIFIALELQFTPSPREMVMGESPRKVRGVGESIKQTLVLG